MVLSTALVLTMTGPRPQLVVRALHKNLMVVRDHNGKEVFLLINRVSKADTIYGVQAHEIEYVPV